MMEQPDEQAVFAAILENQRNMAMTELARAVARINVLQAENAKLKAQVPKDADVAAREAPSV
jgi:uncharacterized small protein (DUF1192 family)